MATFLGESCSFDLPYAIFLFSLNVILVTSHLGFEGGTLFLIASVPGLLIFYFSHSYFVFYQDENPCVNIPVA